MQPTKTSRISCLAQSSPWEASQTRVLMEPVSQWGVHLTPRLVGPVEEIQTF
jgi:hypothetical protein